MKTVELPDGMTTRKFVLEEGALKYLPDVLKAEFPGRRPVLIADDNTWKAAGLEAYGYLQEAGFDSGMSVIVLPGTPRLHPLESISQELASGFSSDAVPVAIGSGVINDLVKRAAGIAGLEYCCVPTACSVDGYTSAGGAMSVDGRKITMPCPAPAVIVADEKILATAPLEMLSSGYADLFTKIPAGADWIVAEELGIEPIVPCIWNLVQADLRDWLADTSCLGKIFHGLANTGFSMQLYKDSRPASGAEHMLSHIWEMESLKCNGDTVSHGFQVAIGTIALVGLMEFVINTPVEKARELAVSPKTAAERQEEIKDLLKRGCYGEGIPETAMSKFLESEAILARRELIWDKWPEIQRRIKKQIFSLEDTKKILRAAGAPVHYSEIGLDKDQYVHAIRTAQLIRRRYTTLDLLYEAGLLDCAIEISTRE